MLLCMALDTTTLPARSHRLELVAEPADVDELGHVSNVSYVRWLQEGALALSQAAGFDLEAYRELGCVFVVRRHDIEYIRPAFADENIALVLWIEEIRGARIVCKTRILRADTNQELARATSTWAFVSFETQRPQRVPPQVLRAFGVHAQPGG
jgi:acyl-CoA thioester hydrolase